MDKKQLFSATRMKCECYMDEAVQRSEELLQRCERLLSDGKKAQAVNKMQEQLNTLKELQKKHMEWRADYARDLVDLVKIRTLNVGPRQTKLQTVPYLTGREKRERQEEKEEKASSKRGKRAKK